MKVLFLWKALVSAAYHRKLEELTRYGVDLSVIVPERWGNINLEIQEGKGYRIIPREVRLSGHNHFHWYPGLTRLVKEIRPDIMHIEEEPYSVVTLQAMQAAKKVGAKTLFVAWQNIYKKYPFPFSLIENYNFRNADIAIAGSEEVKSVLERKGYDGEVAIIPLGVNEELFTKKDVSRLKEKLSLASDNFVIGYMGRLVEEKGILCLIEAASRLINNFRILLVGSGPQKNDIMNRAKSLGIEGKVSILDQVTSMEVPNYLNCFDCLVLPSLTKSNWKEQFGRVLIEAMACEVPVIGSTSGEIPHVIGAAGLVFNEGDIADLAKTLERIIIDGKLRASFAKKGRARVLAHYTQRIIAQDTIKAYEHLMQAD